MNRVLALGCPVITVRSSVEDPVVAFVFVTRVFAIVIDVECRSIELVPPAFYTVHVEWRRRVRALGLRGQVVHVHTHPLIPTWVGVSIHCAVLDRGVIVYVAPLRTLRTVRGTLAGIQ